jgi:uncharacterized Zn finger protein
MAFKRRGSNFGRDRGFYPPTGGPRPVTGGLQAKSKRGSIGETWWSRRFIEVLEDFNDGPRLARGRAYARRGQVIDLDIGEGEVSARVQGSRVRPYSVTIGVTVLGDAEWSRVEEAMAGRAVFLARLLAGEMPREIEEAFEITGLSLFPDTDDDLDASCSCPDWEVPCKHIAAVYYLLAEAFDRDPFLIFAWRGRPRDRLLAELRALRGQGGGAHASGETDAPDAPGEADAALMPRLEDLIAPADADDAEPLGAVAEDPAAGFWDAAGGVTLPRGEPRAVTMPEAILRDLGASGVSVGGPPLEDVLAPAYRSIAAAAVVIARGEVRDESS